MRVLMLTVSDNSMTREPNYGPNHVKHLDLRNLMDRTHKCLVCWKKSIFLVWKKMIFSSRRRSSSGRRRSSSGSGNSRKYGTNWKTENTIQSGKTVIQVEIWGRGLGVSGRSTRTIRNFSVEVSPDLVLLLGPC